MTHVYSITGMTCEGCREKLQELLSKVNGVESVSIDLIKGEAIIDMSKHIPVAELKSALKNYPKYQITEVIEKSPALLEKEPGNTASWFAIYKPIIIVGVYITGVTLLIEFVNGDFIWESWMQNFMAAFFLVFSFFKFLDIEGFADGYSTYDIIAVKWRGWSYVYAFIELALGVAFLLKFKPLFTNGVTFIIMSISITGVLQSVLNKRKIKCACLGAVFNLPMSTVTIIEDALMIAMSVVMIINLLQ